MNNNDALEKGAVWITWEKQRRNSSMASALNVILLEFILNRSRFFKYIYLSWATVKYLFINNPKVIFCQSPSIVLALVCVIWGRVSGVKVVVDAHNGGIFPLEGRSRVLNFLAQLPLRYSFGVIVTNNFLRKFLLEKNICSNVYVVPDPLPEAFICDLNSKSDAPDTIDLVIPCSWSEDEPICEIINSAKGNLKFSYAITGRPKLERYGLSYSDIPSNVKLLGFVDDKEYVDLIKSSDAVMVLTRRENCLVCGAYEALAARKPLILSDTEINRTFFEGATLTANDAVSIRLNLQHILDDYSGCLTVSDQLASRIQNQVRQLLQEMKRDLKM